LGLLFQSAQWITLHDQVAVVKFLCCSISGSALDMRECLHYWCCNSSCV